MICQTMNQEPSKASFLEISADQAGQRIDNVLINKLKGVPRSRIYRIVRKGEVRVNKKRIKPDYRVQEGDVLRIPPIRMAEEKTPMVPSQKAIASLEDNILWEDKQLLIINKPAGLAVHGGSGVSLGAIEILRSSRPKQTLELAHRLDRDTSGCLIVSKKSSILKQLHELLRNQQIKKVYLALVKGRWPSDLKRIDVPLQKFQMRSGERMVQVSEDGKEALTDFKVLRYYGDSTLLEITLQTGRTHQIRVHALYAGHPIVGDEKYGDKKFNQLMRRKGCKRLFLHAASVGFKLPEAEKAIAVEAKLEDQLQKVLEVL